MVPFRAIWLAENSSRYEAVPIGVFQQVVALAEQQELSVVLSDPIYPHAELTLSNAGALEREQTIA